MRFLVVALFLGLFACVQVEGSWSFEVLSTYKTGEWGGTETNSWSENLNAIFSSNGAQQRVDMLSLGEDGSLTLVKSFDVSSIGSGSPTSVDSFDYRKETVIAITIPAATVTDPGTLVFFEPESGAELVALTVGSLPDHCKFSPEGDYLAVANEGEEDGSVDPMGTVSIIPLGGIEEIVALRDSDVRTATFDQFTTLPAGMHKTSPTNTVAQDIEPEFCTFSDDGLTVYVSLQESNGLAVVDVANANVTALLPLGFIDRSIVPFDASDEDAMINIAKWPHVVGMPQPDGIEFIMLDGVGYILTANEGDAKDSEETRVGDLAYSKLNPISFPDPDVQLEKNLGRLQVTTTEGVDVNCQYQTLYHFGSRSMSVYRTDGLLVSDTGSTLEVETGQASPANFNADGADQPSFDARSDAKGPEPESLTTGWLDGTPYAFVLLERIGGVAMFDLCDITAPRFETYFNNRDFDVDISGGDYDAAGDLGPEDVHFIPKDESPTGNALLVLSSEVSGTVSVYELTGKNDEKCKVKSGSSAASSLGVSSVFVLLVCLVPFLFDM
eukprot:CAMPEP_0201479026 /NCGR_PEP_ID=MMETSP0151_2-20130828/3768_1 /ASSEMBLY_ACC=CAM_ASM_000257 /TAXON_ID=200890 /ORGANISM="Paramoeba atlantica, Strain 621/1 / CCAP 1560/9" /LENGTH=553 /DNA_ID=CAMNT_0047860345 /DNA_START=66 /DNA_END=1727 /DNA_ORIENTATION=-